MTIGRDDGMGMTDGPRRILHVGQRKTGTTWLQRSAGRAAKAGRLLLAHKKLVLWSRSASSRVAQSADYDRLAAVLPDQTKLPVLASCETLIVYDPAQMAAAVGRRWPDAHVLVTTRAPQDYLLSSFRNNSASGYEEPAEFARRFSEGHMSRSHDLDGLARSYAEALGSDRVHFLPYELLRDDRDAYIDRLEAVIGVKLREFLLETKVNASAPMAFLLMARRVNALVGAKDPDILRTKDWVTFMRFGEMAASQAPGMEEAYSNFIRGNTIASDALPRLNRSMLSGLVKRMSVLRGLEAYQPYLERYGFRLTDASDPAPDALRG